MNASVFKRIALLVAVAAIAGLALTVVGLTDVFAGGRHGNRIISCPSSAVEEGESFTLAVKHSHGGGREKMSVFWFTRGDDWADDDFTATGGSDYPTLYDVNQEGRSGWDFMSRAIYTTDDDKFEDDETFEVGFWSDDSFRSCVITIRDNETPSVVGQEIISTPPDGYAYRLGETIKIDIEFDYEVTANNNPVLPLTIGGEWKGAKYKSGSGTTKLRFEYEVKVGDLDRDGASIRWRSKTGLGQEKVKSVDYPDRNANHYTSGTESIEGQRVIGLPYITSVDMVSTPISEDTYYVGDVIEFAFTFSQNVDATGAGTGMTLSGDYKTARYRRGSGTNTIVFGYTVQPDDSDTNGISVRNGGYNDDGSTYGFWNITARGTNKAAYKKFSGLSNQSGHKVDGGLGPRVTDVSVASTPSSGRVYNFGETIFIDVTFAVEVLSVGNPVISIMFDGADQDVSRDAAYHSGSGTKTLRFAYDVAIEDRDKNGLTIEAQGSNSFGTGNVLAKFDASGNQNADHAFSARNNISGHRVYGLGRPTIEGLEVVSTPWDGRQYRRGEQVLINVVFSREVEEVYWHIPHDKHYYHPDLILHIGDSQSHTVRYAPYRLSEGRPEGGGTSGTDILQFIYYVKKADLDLDGVTITGLGEEEGRSIRIQAIDDNDASVDHSAYTWPVVLLNLQVNGNLRRDPLTAGWDGAPESHNGSRSFSFHVAFSEDVVIGHNTGLKPSLTVTNGSVTRTKRVSDRKDLWEVTVKPDSDADMTVSLRAKQPCSDWGAICASSDERRLSEGPELTVLFVAEPLTAELKDVPASHNGSNAFTFRIAFSEDIDVNFKTLRDHSLEATNGSVTKAKRVDSRNDLWQITVKPSSNADVTVVLAADRACDVEGAICTGRGGRLSNRLELTVNGPGG